MKKSIKGDAPNFSDANIAATVRTGWNPERMRFELSVTLYRLQPEGEEPTTVRILTGPDDLPEKKI
jgi:hypothetical protein